MARCLLAFGTGLAASLLLTFPVRKLTRSWGIVDRPNERSSHRVATPRGGGLAIVIACLLTILCLVPLGAGFGLTTGCVFVVALVSLCDDVRSLSFALRLATQTVAAIVLVIALHLPVKALDLPGHAWILPEWLGLFLSILFIVAYCNFFNFMDGINGLACGQGALTGAALVPLTYGGGDRVEAVIAATISGAAAGFLPHNFPKARIFMGDVGSVTLGFTLAVLSQVAHSRGNVPWTAILLVHAVFLFDACATVLKRAIRGQPVWRPHREHSYQLLVRSGWSHVRTSLVFWLLTAESCLAGLVYAWTEGAVQWAALLVTVASLVALSVYAHWRISTWNRQSRLSEELIDLTRVPAAITPPTWSRYIRTIAALKPSQFVRLVATRLRRRLVSERLAEVRAVPSLRPFWSPRAAFLDDPAARSFRPGSHVLSLLSVERDLGDPIDWTPSGVPLLWQLELSYFHWLPSNVPWVAARPWIADWLGRAGHDLRAPGWFPFGVAQRVLRLTRLIRGPWWNDLQDDPLLSELLRHLYAECRYLDRHQEKELLGNHLIKTAVALYAGGRFFEGPEADAWLRRAEAILTHELGEQILEDGGHYERSPMYHLFVLVDVADALNVTPPGDSFETELQEAMDRMARFAADCAHGDEEIPLFNDSVLDQAPARRDVLRYIEQIGSHISLRRQIGFVALPHFGLFRLGDERSGLWLDAGETGPPFLQAHAHADTASFELAIGTWRVICDSGMSSYQDLEQRAWYRSTPAHNTVSLGGESSSDCWGSFRATRRTRIRELAWNDDPAEQLVRVSHDGFRHLSGSPRHERTVKYHEGLYTIRDRIEGSGQGPLRCDAFLYLGPDVIATPCSESSETSAGGSHGGAVENAGFDFTSEHEPGLTVRVEIRFTGPIQVGRVFLEPAELAPRFHDRRPGHRIRAACIAGHPQFGLEWRVSVVEQEVLQGRTTSSSAT